jgi:hypothetical protein
MKKSTLKESWASALIVVVLLFLLGIGMRYLISLT